MLRGLQGDTTIYIFPSEHLGLLSIHPLHTVAGRFLVGGFVNMLTNATRRFFVLKTFFVLN